MKPLFPSILLAGASVIASAQQSPDLLLLNGRIFTADPSRPWAEAIAIQGNTIQAVGTTEELAGTGGRDTKAIDLEGLVVVPGLNEARAALPVPLDSFQMSTNSDSSMSDLELALPSAADESPSSAWITGVLGLSLLRDPRVTADAMEKAAPGRKVILCTSNRRACVLSAAALHALRINADAADTPGGSYDRDAAGHITGKLFDYAAWNAQLALRDQLSDEDLVNSLREFVTRALSAGITSVQMPSPVPILRFEKIIRHANLPLRIRIIRTPQGRENDTFRRIDSERKLSPLFGTSWIVDEPTGGHLNFSAAEISSILSDAAAGTDQLIFSVAGAHTFTTLVETMKAMTGVDWKSKRVRFDTPEAVPAEALPAAKDLGVVIVVAPLRSSASLKTLTNLGIPVALTCGGDQHPFRCLAAAAEEISRQAAVDAYTRGGAFAEFAESEKGMIAPGKVADLAVLSNDIFKIDPSEIADTSSLLTILDGNIVYDAGVVNVPGRKRVRPFSVDDAAY